MFIVHRNNPQRFSGESPHILSGSPYVEKSPLWGLSNGEAVEMLGEARRSLRSEQESV